MTLRCHSSLGTGALPGAAYPPLGVEALSLCPGVP